MEEIGWQWAVLFALWTYLAYRIGVAVGQQRKARDLSEPPVTQDALPAMFPSLLPGETRDAIEDAMRRGKKIEAIRILREASGMGLKEAKDMIEAMEHLMRSGTTRE